VPDTDRLQERQQTLLRFVHRELVLLIVLIGATVVAFMLTRAAAGSNERIRREDAAALYDIGRQRRSSGQTADAVAAFRRATSKAPGNQTYALGLAGALQDDKQYDAARDVLGSLRDRAPDDATVNVELARLESRRQNLADAIRHYQSALNALWSPDAGAQRRGVREELIRLLLANGQRSRALSEILILTLDVPDDADAQSGIGELFLQAGDPRRALDHFALALAREPRHANAAAGAARAAFSLGDYTRARRYLASAPQDRAGLVELRTLTDLVLAYDPLAPRLSTSERRRRLAAGLEQAQARAGACGTVPADAGPPADSGDVDIEAGVRRIYQIERSAADSCGAPAPLDRALLLIAQMHGADEP